MLFVVEKEAQKATGFRGGGGVNSLKSPIVKLSISVNIL